MCCDDFESRFVSAGDVLSYRYWRKLEGARCLLRLVGAEDLCPPVVFCENKRRSRDILVCLLGCQVRNIYVCPADDGRRLTVELRRVKLNNFALIFAWLLCGEKELPQSVLLFLLSRLILAIVVSLVWF